MTSITLNGSYNKFLHFSQNNDLQFLSTLNDGIVKDEIMRFINTNSKSLNLTNIGLHFLPDDIFNFPMFRDHLYELSLSQNPLLETLLASIGNLSVLRHLELSQTSLKTLPDLW